jgi:recombination protein RecT
VNEVTTPGATRAPGNTALATPAANRLSTMPLKQVQTLDQLFGNAEFMQRVSDSLPRHMTPERMLRTMVSAVQRAPLLAKADLRTLVGAFLTCSQVGLEPNTPLGHLWLIPFKKRSWNPQTRARDIESVEVQLVFGYPGLLDLSYRSPLVTSIGAHVVFEGDHFDYDYGTSSFLSHKPKGGGVNRRPVFAYMTAKLRDGFAFEVLPYEDVLRIRNGSQAYQQAIRAKEEAESNGRRPPLTYTEAPWVKYETAMARKTAFRSGSKWLPRSVELASVIAIDEAQERRRGIQWGAVLEANDGDYLTAATVAAERPEEEPTPGPAPDAAFNARPQTVRDAHEDPGPQQDDGDPGPFGSLDDGDPGPQQHEQRAPDPAPQQQREAPRQADPAPKAAPQRQQRAATPKAEPKETSVTVFDAFGEPVDGIPPLTDRGDFATVYAAQWNLCASAAQVEALAEHNADGLAWAREATKAKKALDALTLPTTAMQKTAPPSQSREPLDEAAPSDPTSSRGDDHDPGPKAQQAAPLAGADPDLDWANDLIGKLDGASKDDVGAWVQNAAIRARMSRLQRERKELFDRVEKAFRQRLAKQA